MAFIDRLRPETVNISQILKINTFFTENDHIVYEIQVTIGQYYWTCKRRYSEFNDLHQKLVHGSKIDPDLLPGKFIFGVKNEGFLKKRQVDLEVYLLRLWHHLRCFPRELAEFLDLHFYELHFITEALSRKFYRSAHSGEKSASSHDEFVFTPLQIYAINRRLQLPEPTGDAVEPSKDFGHLMDFVYRLKTVRILGSDSLLGSSNIIENQLSIDLMIFKSAEELDLDQLRPAMLTGFENLRTTVQKLKVHRTLQSLSVLLLRDASGWFVENDFPPCLYWDKLISADLSDNRLEKLDTSVKLLNQVKCLDLTSNQLRSVDNLHHLHNLQKLILPKNYLSDLDKLNAKIGNVQKIVMARNQLQSLKGFAKLYSLTFLDVSDNEISSLSEVEHLKNLPCLTHLSLATNPITLVVDYRIRVLTCFDARAAEMVLDGIPATPQEISHVNILLALKKGQTSATHIRNKRASEANYSGSPSPSPARTL